MLLGYLAEQRRHENASRRALSAASFRHASFSAFKRARSSSRRACSCCLKTALMADWMIFSRRACFAASALTASALTRAFLISSSFLLAPGKSSEGS